MRGSRTLPVTPSVQLGARPTQTPHPAVVRVVVSEGDTQSLGSGSLVHITEQYGLVITNWHVVRDARGPVEVIFPDGFRSGGTVMKLDDAWDLAAIGIWRPNVEPVKLSETTPRPGDALTIAGYGSGPYRAATGRCTQYVAPGNNDPFEMIELSAEARQGDSGGPIFNAKGELAGVLLGANKGHTIGSYCGRVRHFLADVRPQLDRGQTAESSAHEVLAQQPLPRQPLGDDGLVALPAAVPAQPLVTYNATPVDPFGFDPLEPSQDVRRPQTIAAIGPTVGTVDRRMAVPESSEQPTLGTNPSFQPGFSAPRQQDLDSKMIGNSDRIVIHMSDILGKTLGEQIKTVLAALGALALIVTSVKLFKIEDA